MQIILSTNQTPEINAAYEELLFRQTRPREAHMFLYLNRPAVLIGRNQNPWAECNLDFCNRHHITLLRRISGGGTVYHDLNNLNVAMVLPRKAYNPEKLIRIITRALVMLGVPHLYHNDHYSIFSNKKKLCGTAFALTGNTAMLHACILVDSNLPVLTQALQAPIDQRITGTCVGSNRMPVTKVTDFIPHMTVQKVALAIIRQTAKAYRKTRVQLASSQDFPNSDLKFYESVHKFRDPKWTYGHTNDFILERTLPQGLLKLTIASGFVSSAQLFGMDGNQTMIPALTGLPLTNLQQSLSQHLPPELSV